MRKASTIPWLYSYWQLPIQCRKNYGTIGDCDTENADYRKWWKRNELKRRRQNLENSNARYCWGLLNLCTNKPYCFIEGLQATRNIRKLRQLILQTYIARFWIDWNRTTVPKGETDARDRYSRKTILKSCCKIQRIIILMESKNRCCQLSRKSTINHAYHKTIARQPLSTQQQKKLLESSITFTKTKPKLRSYNQPDISLIIKPFAEK